jgi:hypothetical protein
MLKLSPFARRLLLRLLVGLMIVYVCFGAYVWWAMHQPPEIFGSVMARMYNFGTTEGGSSGERTCKRRPAKHENVKVVQELMRHASSRFTLDVYSQTRKGAKRQAQQRVVQLILPENCDDAVAEILREGVRNDVERSGSLIMGSRSGSKNPLRDCLERART